MGQRLAVHYDQCVSPRDPLFCLVTERSVFVERLASQRVKAHNQIRREEIVTILGPGPPGAVDLHPPPSVDSMAARAAQGSWNSWRANGRLGAGLTTVRGTSHTTTRPPSGTCVPSNGRWLR